MLSSNSCLCVSCLLWETQDNGFLLVIDGVRKEKERLTAANLMYLLHEILSFLWRFPLCISLPIILGPKVFNHYLLLFLYFLYRISFSNQSSFPITFHSLLHKILLDGEVMIDRRGEWKLMVKISRAEGQHWSDSSSNACLTVLHSWSFVSSLSFHYLG